MQVDHWIFDSLVACYTRACSSKVLHETVQVCSIVDKVKSKEANPQYAHIRFPDGRKDTVALKQLAAKHNDANHIPETPSQGQKPEQKNINEPTANSQI